MRQYVRERIDTGTLDSGLFQPMYKSIKKGFNNELKLARLDVTANQPIKCTTNIHKEASNDFNDK